MNLASPRARAALYIVLSGGATFLLIRIALARVWEAGAWREPPLSQVVVLGAIGAVGILCGLLLFIRPGAVPSMACVAWAAVATVVAIGLAARSDDSAEFMALLTLAAAGVALPWRTSRAGQAGSVRRR